MGTKYILLIDLSFILLYAVLYTVILCKKTYFFLRFVIAKQRERERELRFLYRRQNEPLWN